MIFFDPLTAASLLVLANAAPSLPANMCAQEKQVQIEVIPSSKPVKYDTNKTLAGLQGIKMDTVNPHSYGGLTVTQGYTRGGIQLQPRVEISYKSWPDLNLSCIAYDKIKITVDLDPTITIAREVKADPCMGPLVKEHELKHVKVDHHMVNKYAASIGQKVYKALKERGFTVGPVPTKSVKEITAQMQHAVFQIVEHESKKMDLERIEMQQAVDSKAEYSRISNACPDFNPSYIRKALEKQQRQQYYKQR